MPAVWINVQEFVDPDRIGFQNPLLSELGDFLWDEKIIPVGHVSSQREGAYLSGYYHPEDAEKIIAWFIEHGATEEER